MDWLDLVVPSAAILALFAVVALIVVAVVQGRSIRRLENRLAERGDAAEEAALQRIAQLQARQEVSDDEAQVRSRVSMQAGGVVALAALALICVIAGIWYLFVRGDDGSAAAGAGTTTTAAVTTTTPVAPPTPVDSTLVPENVPVVADKAAFEVIVLNASAVSGVASERAEFLKNEGWTSMLTPANEPNGVTDLDTTIVMWAPGRGNRRAAWSVASSLGIERAPRLDGYTSEQIGGADVVVVVGQDIATGGVAPSP